MEGKHFMQDNIKTLNIFFSSAELYDVLVWSTFMYTSVYSPDDSSIEQNILWFFLLYILFVYVRIKTYGVPVLVFSKWVM